MKSITATTLLLPALRLVAAEVHQVQIGPGLSYTPDTVTASEGDIVAFTFGAGHDVTQGSFNSPCQPVNGGIYSGEASQGDVFSVTINSTDPIWIYCSVPGHCQSGMAMVINAPSSGDTLDGYKSAASSVGSSEHPGSVSGGVFGDVSSGSSSAAASGAATATSSSEGSAASSGASAAATSASGAASSASAAVSSAASSAMASASAAMSSTSSAASSTPSNGAGRSMAADIFKLAGIMAGGLAIVA